MTRHRKAVAPLVAAIVAGALAGAAHAGATEPITLTARLAQPVMTSGERQVNFLRIGLNGCAPQRNADRTPVNVALVIDRSGSMSGERIAQAREAAVMAIKRLDDRDIASLVIFDDRIDVPVPAQKVADRNYFATASCTSARATRTSRPTPTRSSWNR
jgi:Ca-activated chloride channel family protein